MALRTKPYTERGIRRVPCSFCGEPAHAQWQACADGRSYRAMCVTCDVAINLIVVAADGNAFSKIRAYAEKKGVALMPVVRRVEEMRLSAQRLADHLRWVPSSQQ